MNKKIFVLFFVVLGFCLSFLPVLAQTSEKINSFISDITINTDSSINVVETIKYNSGGLEKHGIFRNIRLKSYDNQFLHISDISISDINGNNYPYTETKQIDTVSLKIGDPNSTFVGDRDYVIRYKITNALGYFDKYDEIYWNVTGNEWQFPIEKTEAYIHLPNGAGVVQTSSYCGPLNSKLSCINNIDTNFFYNSELKPGYGMTIAVGFTKGIVQLPDHSMDFIFIIFACLPILVPIITFVFLFKKWKKYGKDPKSNRTIIAEYDVPDNLTPIEAAQIIGGVSDGTAISAEIIYLAINGYLKIEKTETKGLFLESDDYILTKVSNSVPTNETDQLLMDSLYSYSENATELKMSSLKNKFYQNIKNIVQNCFKRLVSNEYLKNNNKLVMMCYAFFIVYLFIGFKVTDSSSVLTFPIFKICMFVSSVIALIFSFLMPARTEKGLRTKEYLLGLKEYLNIAEKDRINFNNAPDKKPEIFEKLLPYAMIFGVEKAWAKEFDGIYTQQPKWYSDRRMTMFSAIIFANSINNFSSFTNTAAASGSKGGGFAGGGGGGGGGGSW